MKKARRHPPRRAGSVTKGRRRRLRGFTLTELMVAVAVLIVVILATSKIFGTIGKVTGIGEASRDVMQETAAIERQIRSDLARLAPGGFLAIRCVAVPNDVNGSPLLRPNLPPEAIIRADQLVFFTNGVQSIQTFRGGAGSAHKGQSAVARLYYGHAFQLPQGEAVDPDPAGAFVEAHDPEVDLDNPLLPWHVGTSGMVRTVFRRNLSGPPDDYDTTDVSSIDATQPPATRWLLARQAVVLADDGDNEVVFLGENRSAIDIAREVVINGRVDAAKGQLNDIRNTIVGDGTVSWVNQRATIASDVFYPRAERVAPSMHRVDQALTNHVLASACSSFIIDWTYENAVGGFDLDDDGFQDGVQIDPAGEQPWFGLFDPQRGVDTFLAWHGTPTTTTIFATNIDDTTLTPAGAAVEDAGTDVVVYEAIFGYNQDTPLNAFGFPDPALGYTPWPSAIRITMILHDARTRLENGRRIQFVIDLPRRVE